MARAPRTIRCERLVTPERVISPATIEVSDGVVADVLEGDAARADLVLEGTVLPGYVDLQVNGLGPHDVADASPAEILAISRGLLSHGVTAWLPTVTSSPEADRIAALDAIAEAVQHQKGGARVLGAHLEGPWISPRRAGAHAEEWILPPVAEVVERSLTRHPGLVRVVTFAPEVEGAPGLVRQVVEAGAVAAIGHTEADYSQAQAAVVAGARLATHVFNAMRPPHHRDPGVVGAVLDDAMVTAGMIADGFHLHDVMMRLVFRSKGADRVALVSDSVSSAGVRTSEDGAPLTAAGVLAGSLSTLADGVTNAVRAWVPLEDAATAASATPSRVLGHEGGRVAPGMLADLVVLDDKQRPVATLVGGRLEWEGA